MSRAGRPARRALVLVCALGALHALPGWAAEVERLVFGSFRDADNAQRWSDQLASRFPREFHVERVHRHDGVWYRVRTDALSGEERRHLEEAAVTRGIDVWVVRGTLERPGTVTSTEINPVVVPQPPVRRNAGVADAPAAPLPRPVPEDDPAHAPSRPVSYADFDIGVQTRGYGETGSAGQDQFQPSMSLRFEYHRSWDDDRSELTFTPFLRLDAVDDERTHGDVRELYWTRVGRDWELHVGARQIFWGVTEFNHLVDIVNQTDLVENIDGEDKLGQPMVQLSLVRDWGILDVFALTGFRERTFPGKDGRLRLPVLVDSDAARYVSGAGQSRVDGAIRWSHHLGPLNFGIHHFSGTGRDPRFVAEPDGTGGIVLVPEYHVIDQTGIDAQALFGDWAWKLEALTRSGDGDRYEAYTGGFERTLVGVLGSRADLGLVVEYMYDERDELAYNTLFEHDLAVGTRWQFNDLADTSALLGVIWDVDTDEYVFSIEASRRFGPSWMAVLESRVFGGADALSPGMPLPLMLDGEVKSRALQRDDYIQLELTRYF